MKRFHKLLLSACVLGIVLFVGMSFPFVPPDELAPAAHQNMSEKTKHGSDGFKGSEITSVDPSILPSSISHQTKSIRRMQTDSDARMPARQDDLAEATIATSPRISRKLSTLISHLADSPEPPASLVWIDGLTAEQDTAIQNLAEEFNTSLQPLSNQNPSTDYAEHYNNQAQLNDIRFQARYGDLLWMRHHIAAHHLNSEKSTSK